MLSLRKVYILPISNVEKYIWQYFFLKLQTRVYFAFVDFFFFAFFELEFKTSLCRLPQSKGKRKEDVWHRLYGELYTELWGFKSLNKPAFTWKPVWGRISQLLQILFHSHSAHSVLLNTLSYNCNTNKHASHTQGRPSAPPPLSHPSLHTSNRLRQLHKVYNWLTNISR